MSEVKCLKTFLKKRKAITLIEIVGVMVIIGIITVGIGLSVSSSVKRGNRETAVSELQLYATSIADAYYDSGAPDYTAAEIDDFKDWLYQIQTDYLNLQFDMASVQATTNGFTVMIAQPRDVYEKEYQAWFITNVNVMPYVMIASGGENGRIESSGYATGDYADDVVMICRPKM